MRGEIFKKICMGIVVLDHIRIHLIVIRFGKTNFDLIY